MSLRLSLWLSAGLVHVTAVTLAGVLCMSLRLDAQGYEVSK